MCVPAALVLACDADARLFREVITDPGHVLHKHLPEARQINCNLRPVPMGLDYPLRMTGTLFPGYFSRTCINRSVAQLYLGVLIHSLVATILIRYCYSSCG